MLEFAGNNGLNAQLIFASEIADPSPFELSAFYQMASVFIFPSFYEGFGIPILEARFSGTPVIASNSSCLDEAGGESSSYFNPKDGEELADLLMSSNNLKSIYPGRFKLEELTKRMIRLYN